MTTTILALQLITFAVNLALGAFVFFANPKARVNRVFAAFSAALALWNFSLFAIITGFWPQLIWSRAGFTFGVIMAATLFYFSVIFPTSHPGKKLNLAILAPNLILALFTLTPFMVSRVEVVNGYITGDLGPVLPFVTLQHILGFFGALIILGLKYRAASGLQKQQLFYVLTAFIFFISTFLTTNLILPVFWGIFQLNNLGPVFSLPMVALIGYAILRHRLLDIRVVIQRGLIYALLLSIISGFYLIGIFVLEYFFHPAIGISALASGGITAVLGIFGIPVIERFFRRITDPIFFRDRYDYSRSLEELSAIIAKSQSLKELLRQTSKKIEETLRAVKVTYILEENSGGLLELIKATGQSIFFRSDGREASRSDVRGDGRARELEKILDYQCNRDFEILLPFAVEKEIIGALGVGPKKSGDTYSREDETFLKTFANQAATALKKAELYEKVKRHSAELEEKVRARTRDIETIRGEEHQMIVDISHGLQTPLTVVKAQLELMKRRAPKNKKLLDAERSIDEISKFIYDLLNLARLESGALEFRKKPEDLGKIIEELAEYFRVLAEEKRIALRTELEKDVRAECDKKRIEELVTNLVSNAVKYSRPQGARHILISLRTENGRAEIAVEDNGVGIRAEDLPKLFTRFFRGENGEKGSGLGLAISKKIAEMHGGTVKAESTPGDGAKFTVLIPLK